MKKHRTKKESETRVLAKKFAAEILKKPNKNSAVVIGLVGELGAGKTTFVKSFLKEAGVKRKITSPTFIIMRRFRINKGLFSNVFHIDAYRIKTAKDLKPINAEKILEDPSNIVLVEWADRIEKDLPKSTIWVKFRYGKERNEREITFN